MPMMGLRSIRSVFSDLSHTDMIDWPSFVSQHMLNQYDYFSVYFIQLTFISGGIWILDLTHLCCKKIGKRSHKNSNSKLPVGYQKNFVDTYEFCLGLWCSYTLTCYSIALVFAVFCPWVLLF